MIDDLGGLVRAVNDNATEIMLQWFVAEQVEEEEATAQEVVDKLRHAGDDGPGLLVIDRELGQRRGGDPGEAAADAPAD